jgi:hypothetical protein
MAGYSGTPLAKKLGVRDGSRVLLVGAPQEMEETIGVLPPGAAVERRAARGVAYDVIVLFAPDGRALKKEFAAAKGRMKVNGGLWVAWPKKASGVKTDLTEDAVREVGLAGGLVDNKVCAIDETWSGLRLVVRVKDRR